MAKKSSLVDKALEVSRKNRVPKKPVKTKGKKTVPAVLDWGTGIPEDKLAYLNDDEMALVQAKRTFKGKRSVDGVPAFPDPGDTAAGAKSSGPDRGPTGGPSRTSPSSGAGAGSGGLGGGGKGGPGGSPGGSPGAGGSQSSPSGGQSSPSGGSGGQKATPSGGPGGGSLSAPARSAPSSAPSSPAGTRGFTGGFTGGYDPVSSAPPSMSWQGAVDRIAQGSSVIGNPDRQKQFTDRVPQATPQTVKYSQEPTVGPNRGLGYPAVSPANYPPAKQITDRVLPQGKQYYDRVPTQAMPSAPSTPYGPSVTPADDPYSQRYSKVASYLGSVPPTPKPAYQPSDMRAATRSLSVLSGPNQGLGYSPAAPRSFAQPDYSIGGNGPLSDEGVPSYDRNAQDSLNAKAATRGLDAGILGPSVPAGTAIQRDPYFGAEQVANRYSKPLPSIGVNPNLYSSPVDISRPTTIAQDPSLAGRAASINPQTGLPVGEKITDRLPGSEAMPPGDVYKTPGPQMANVSAPVVAPTIGVNPNLYSSPIKIQQPVSPPVDRLVQLSNYAIQRQTPENLSAAFANPNAAWGEFAGMENAINRVPASSEFNSFGRNLPSEYTGGFNSSPASAPTTSYSGNVFNTNPMQEAEDIRRAVALAQGPAPSRQQSQSDINVPGYPGPQADISPSQGNYPPSQEPAYDVSPSQQGKWTSAQRNSYLNSLGDNKTGRFQVSQNGGQPQGSPVTPAAPMTTLAAMPDWVDYSYLYNDYPQLALGATPNIGAFNQYNATFRRGGRVGDSIEAALRLALQGIVSRNKTS